MYLLVTLEDEMEKKLNWDSVATALASKVLPVPGGPNSNTPDKALSSHPQHRGAIRPAVIFTFGRSPQSGKEVGSEVG